MKNTNADLSGRVVKSELHEDMAVFDELSPVLRAALNHAPDLYSAIEARQILARGLTDAELAEIICPPPNTSSTK